MRSLVVIVAGKLLGMGRRSGGGVVGTSPFVDGGSFLIPF